MKLIERFLGEGAASGGPFGVLGVDPEHCTDDSVIAALLSRLDEVAKHPQGGAPEADEVRLALRAAAAQLLDAGVRQHLLELWSGQGGAAPAVRGGVPGPGRGAVSRPVPRDIAMERDVLVTLARYGGWNRQARQRLAILAHLNGVSVDQLGATLRKLADQRSSSATKQTPVRVSHAGHASAPEPDVLQEAPLSTRVLAAGGVLALFVISAVGLWVLIQIVSDQLGDAGPTVSFVEPGDPARGVGVDDEPGEPDRDADGPVSDPLEAPVGVGPGPQRSGAIAELRAASGLFARDAEGALDQYRRATDAIALGWPELDDAGLMAAIDGVVEFLFVSRGNTLVRDQVMDDLVAWSDLRGFDRAGVPPEGVARSTWGVGMLVRLGRERELGPAVAMRIDGTLLASLGSSRPASSAGFGEGAIAALRRVGGSVLDGPRDDSERTIEAMERWAAGVSRAASDEVERDRLILDMLERFMMDAGEPTTDRVTFGAIRVLAGAPDWSNERVRRRLIAWFDDDRVSTEDLRQVTWVVAAHDGAGVADSLVLSANASGEARTALRDQYAGAWEIRVREQDETLARWRTESMRWLQADVPSDSLGVLRDAAYGAALNQAASLLWLGDSEQAATALDGLAGLRAAAAPASGGEVTIPRGESEWARRFLAANQSIPARMELLNELERKSGPLLSVESDLLAEQALLGVPAELRALAQRVLLTHRDDPGVMVSLLETAPRAGKVRGTSRLISVATGRTLPDVRSASWDVEARRALVERAIELLAGPEGDASIDGYAALLADAYLGRARLASSGGKLSPGEASGSLGVASAALWRLWEQEAANVLPGPGAPFSIDDVRRRRAGRLELADGPVRTFAAEQVSIAELMGVVVEGECVGCADQVRAITEAMHLSRRRAPDVFAQLRAVEHAMVELWSIRFRERSDRGGSVARAPARRGVR